jgi:hypothetical protein
VDELRLVRQSVGQEAVVESWSDPEVVEAVLRYARAFARRQGGMPEKRSSRCRGWHVWTPARPDGFDVASTAELAREVGCARESIFAALGKNRAPIPPAGLDVPPGAPGIAVKGCFMVDEVRWANFNNL